MDNPYGTFKNWFAAMKSSETSKSRNEKWPIPHSEYGSVGKRSRVVYRIDSTTIRSNDPAMSLTRPRLELGYLPAIEQARTGRSSCVSMLSGFIPTHPPLLQVNETPAIVRNASRDPRDVVSRIESIVITDSILPDLSVHALHDCGHSCTTAGFRLNVPSNGRYSPR